MAILNVCINTILEIIDTNFAIYFQSTILDCFHMASEHKL